MSPVRVSRLKKRRRLAKEGGADGGDAGGGGGTGRDVVVCALQNLTAASASSKRNARRGSDAGAARGDAKCKENLLNGRASSHERPSLCAGGDGSGVVDDAKAGLDANAWHGADPPSNSNEGESGGGFPVPDANGDTSTLGFMDAMEPSLLVSAMPSMLGIDLTRYKSSSPGFKRDLERAFEYAANSSDEGSAERKCQGTYIRSNPIYHRLVGRIDPHVTSTDYAEKDRIAFPRCTASCSQAETREDSKYMIFRHLNLSRKSEHGMTFPSSWYRFPTAKTKKPQSPRRVADRAMANEQPTTKPASGGCPAETTQPGAFSVYHDSDEDGQYPKNDGKEQSTRGGDLQKNDQVRGTAKRNPFELFAPGKYPPAMTKKISVSTWCATRLR